MTKKNILDHVQQSFLSGLFPTGAQPQKKAPEEKNIGAPAFEGIPYEVVQRRVKYARVEFRPVGLRVIVPRGVNALKVLHVNRVNVLNKYQKMRRHLEEADLLLIHDRSPDSFEALVRHYLEKYAQVLQVTYREVRFRKMWRRWGTCRSNGAITINRELRFVPDRFVAYIVYHELSHLRVRGHNQAFKNIIALEFPDYRRLDRELNLYGLRLLVKPE